MDVDTRTLPVKRPLDRSDGRKPTVAYSIRAESNLECALAASEHGVHTLPVSHPHDPSPRWRNAAGKMPALDAWQINASKDSVTLRRWFDGTSLLNIGFLTGETSGIVVIDIDAGKGGFEGLADAEAKYGKLPLGPRVNSGGGGSHLYFRYPAGHGRIRNRTGLAKGVDFKADQGQVVAPFSLHPSGRRYTWADGLALGEIELPYLPQEWLDFILGDAESVAKSTTGAMPDGDHIAEGTRNETLFRRACALRARGADRDRILSALREMNKACAPPLDEAELASIADSASKYAPALPFSDTGNARRLVEQFGEDIRFHIETRKWLVWTGKVWSTDHNA